MRHPNSNMENNSGGSDVGSGNPEQEVPEGSNINNCDRDSCDVLEKNVLASCPWIKNLLDPILKLFDRISLAEEISWQPIFMWLFVINLIQIHNKKEQMTQKINTKFTV